MDIRVNDDTVPKMTVNMKLKRKYPQGRLTSKWEQYVRKKSHGRKI
jgi:cell division protein FtsI/penicillin-binding protein 2